MQPNGELVYIKPTVIDDRLLQYIAVIINIDNLDELLPIRDYVRISFNLYCLPKAHISITKLFNIIRRIMPNVDVNLAIVNHLSYEWLYTLKNIYDYHLPTSQLFRYYPSWRSKVPKPQFNREEYPWLANGAYAIMRRRIIVI